MCLLKYNYLCKHEYWWKFICHVCVVKEVFGLYALTGPDEIGNSAIAKIETYGIILLKRISGKVFTFEGILIVLKC